MLAGWRRPFVWSGIGVSHNWSRYRSFTIVAKLFSHYTEVVTRKPTGRPPGRPPGKDFPLLRMFRFTEQDAALLRLLAQEEGCSDAAAVRRLIREEADRRSVRVAQEAGAEAAHG